MTEKPRYPTIAKIKTAIQGCEALGKDVAGIKITANGDIFVQFNRSDASLSDYDKWKAELKDGFSGT